MDDDYRLRFDMEASELLRELEGKAREEGDLCEHHNQYIGDPEDCPWCKVDELTETLRGSIGDLKPSVMMRWPMAARRAVLYYQCQIRDLEDERGHSIENTKETVEE